MDPIVNPEHNHKTIAYIILGIVVVIALGVYIYIALSNAVPAQPVSSGPTPDELAAQMRDQQRALLLPFTPTSATTAEIKSEQALLKKFK